MKNSEMMNHMGKPRADELFSFSFAQGMSTFQRVEVFHRNMNLPYEHSPVSPSVSDRLLRGKLMLEEFMEFLQDGLGLTLEAEFNGSKFIVDGSQLSVTHIESHRYDPVATLDGICDMKVIADGTGVAFGLPVDQGDWEVFCSNMSKLDEDGNPVVNRCQYENEDHNPDPCVIADGKCIRESHMLDPTKPVGKLLKSDNYVPANLVRVIVEAQPDEQESATLSWLQNLGEVG